MTSGYHKAGIGSGSPGTDASGMAPRVVTRLAIAGMSLVFVLFGSLAVWATRDSASHTEALTRAGLQASGHLLALQALGEIDTKTDLLEDRPGDKRIVAQLASAQSVLWDALDRMESNSAVPAERRLAITSRDEVRELGPAVDTFVAATRSGDPVATRRADTVMDDLLNVLQGGFDDVNDGPAQKLVAESGAAASAQARVENAGLVLVPLGVLFVGLCGWQLRTYRRRSDDAMLATLDVSLRDARTDALTGLANRRALMENLEERAAGGESFVFALADLNGFKHYNDSCGHPAGDALLRRLSVRLEDACAGIGMAARLGGDEFCVVFEEGISTDEACKLLLAALREDRAGFDVTSACGVVRAPEEAVGVEAVLRVADARLYAAKGGGRVTAEQGLSQTLTRMLDAGHPGLGAHVTEVRDLAVACANILEVPAEQVLCIERAGQLHDIGKIAIPESIISKPARLSADEWEVMKQHTVIGERILGGSRELLPVAEIVRSSHERWDGSGYPDGLSGTSIPIGSRIVFVADAFCAMTEPRAYCPTRSREDALEELRNCAGSQFDPAVVEALAAVLESRGRQWIRTPERRISQLVA